MGRKTKRMLLGSVAALVLVTGTLYLAGKNYIYKAVYYNFAGINDNDIFEERLLKPAPKPEPWPLSKSYNKKPLPHNLSRQLENFNTIAFLLIKDDSIQLEKYWQGYGPTSRTNSFSMAKSIIATLVGIAIQEGHIKSVNQPVSDFLPEFREGKKQNITLKHLLQMSSGLDWHESYSNPFSPTTEAYYGTDLRKVIGRLKPDDDPGREFSYESSDTQILAFVLKAATGMPVSDYAEKKLWQRIGAEQTAEWSIDKPGGDEKAYCCFFSNARDFARLGKLYLQNGIWNGDTILPAAYIQEALTPNNLPGRISGKKTDSYGYQWWLLPNYKGQQIFYARGILGQYIIVIPEKNIIVVRLGEKQDVKEGEHYKDTYSLIDAANKLYP